MKLFIPLIIFLNLLTVSPVPGSENAPSPIKISVHEKALDLTSVVQISPHHGRHFQISTAASQDGIVRRIEVEANEDAVKGWAVFALANTTDQQLDRLIVAPHFRLTGSGILQPDLGEMRIANITPSEGFALERQNEHGSDVFLLTLNPGAIVTFVAQLSSVRLPKIYLWDRDAYKDSINAYTLFHGIVIGIAGLLALFLTILFVVRGTWIFPAAAALSWSALAYVSVDFGFLHKIIHIPANNEQVLRSISEIFLAATLIIFLFAYLNLNRWHDHFNYGVSIWLFSLVLIAAIAVYNPPLAAGVARISFLVTVFSGAALIVFLGIEGYDRAVMLVPGWVMIVLWSIAFGLAIAGIPDNNIVQPGLAGGLILVTLLIGFTVIQHTFTGGFLQQGLLSDMERRALALSGSGDILWDWDVMRDRVITQPDISLRLRLPENSLSGAVRTWIPALHAEDRDMFRTLLDMILEHRRGQIAHDFRLRSTDGHYYWFSLRARPVIGANGEVIRCVGTMADVTYHKKSETRLMQDALHDNLTGLPNRELFIKHLETVSTLAKSYHSIQPSLFMIDLDNFKEINDRLGISGGDTVLLTIARRLNRLTKAEDTLCRFSGNRFALLVLVGKNADLAERIAQTINNPVSFAKKNISLTASIGFVTWTKTYLQTDNFLKDSELAMYQAKRFGGNRIEPFRASFRLVGTDRLQIETDLKQALEGKKITLSYQPLFNLADGSIAGFNALPVWEHGVRGAIALCEFISIAESCGLVAQVMQSIMQESAEELCRWHARSSERKIFVWIDLPSAQLIEPDLVSNIRSILIRTSITPSCFRIGFSESCIMQSPEQSLRVIAKLKQLGIGLSLNDFGSGHSSLSYLADFSFDMIRTDTDSSENRPPEHDVLLKSLANMAHEFEIPLVARGSFTPADAVRLKRIIGCSYVQSHLLSGAVKPDTVLSMLASSTRRKQKFSSLRNSLSSKK